MPVSYKDIVDLGSRDATLLAIEKDTLLAAESIGRDVVAYLLEGF